jgi:hypothetical protein
LHTIPSYILFAHYAWVPWCPVSSCLLLLAARLLLRHCSCCAAARCSLFSRAAAHCSTAQLLTALPRSCPLLTVLSRSCSLLSRAAARCSTGRLLAALRAAARRTSRSCSRLSAQLLAALDCSCLLPSSSPVCCSFYPGHSVYTLSALDAYLKHSLPDPLHKGGEADMRPLSLVEVNQAILAWSFYHT